MTYTIKYTDILAFTKDSKKDHSTTIDKIFQTVSGIKSDILLDNFIVITFDTNVKFVDPLFFILLFDLRHEYKSTLVLDIRYMNDTSQHYVHRLLTQYSDLEQFESYSPHNNSEIYIPIDIIEKDNTEHREQEFKRFLEKEKIHLFTNVAHKKSLINDSQYEYSMLPILRLRNFDLKDIDTTIHEDALEPYDKRRKFYNELSLKQSPKKYRENLQNKIEALLEAVGLSTRGLSSSFRDIFFELIDNIRRHTPSQSNAHISFRKDVSSKLYELIISDNSSRGFLNTYKETLEKEKDRLEKSGVKEELLGNYSDVIKDISDDEYEKVLKGLFEIQRTKPNTSDDEIHIHQIPRIAMHFGLPLLVKLLEKLSKESTETKPELKICLHNNNQYFEIKYSFNNQDGKYKFSVNIRSKHNKDGSYIIITFPEDVKLPTPEYNSGGDGSGQTLTNLSFKNNDYKYFLDNRTKIQEQVNKFEFYEDSHIRDDLDDDKINYKCENKCAVIKYTDSSTFSDFLRNIYLYAYKHDVEDIVVINAPLYEYEEDGARENHENTEHLKLLVTMLYGDEDSKTYETSRNILFYSDRDLSAILIGGRDQKEYCYLNQLLSSMDESSEHSSICKKESPKPKEMLPSNLFINFDEDKKSILPFELFDIYDAQRRNSTALSQDSDTFSILRDLIEMHLNEVAKRDDVHIDTGSGYHIDRYMEFKKIFEDSRWVRRLAFRLAMRLPMKSEIVKYYLYGTDKYTNMLISLCYTFLGLKDFKRFKYKLFNIYDDYDYDTLQEKIKNTNKLFEKFKILNWTQLSIDLTLKDYYYHYNEFTKKSILESRYKIYLISSVVINANKNEELIEKNAISAISAIQLDIGNEIDERITPLVKIKNNTKLYKIIDKKYCDKCDSNDRRDMPLLEFTKGDPFFIKDTFFDTIPKKKIVSHSNEHNVQIKWFDSINFGHVERGSNHFLYYINTIKFFNQNRDKIQTYLFEYVSKKVNYDRHKKIVLLTSSHDTNNNFVAMVNQEVFENEAIVLSFNKSRGESNFHDLFSYKDFKWDDVEVYFVDDSIASSYTLRYFYQLLRAVPNIKDIFKVGLDGVIIMIDRISSYDETVLCSYLKAPPNKYLIKLKKFNFSNTPTTLTLKDFQYHYNEFCNNKMASNLNSIHAFTSFDIKPIKTEIEECFLCERNKRYLDLAKKSVLDLMIIQMIKREEKLKKIPYREIPSAKEKSLDSRFKNYLKAMATIYIYQHYVGKTYKEFESFYILKTVFSKKIYQDILFGKSRFEAYDEKFLKKIIDFQSEIALIKALSSPKLSYYYNIRRFAIETILNKFTEEIEKVQKNKNKFELVYLLGRGEKILKKGEIDKNKEFVEFYEEMTNLHTLNVYFATLGYFEDSKILDTNILYLFYAISQNEQVRKIKDGTLLHTYPFAVKFATSRSKEKANYLENNLNDIFQKLGYMGLERKKKFSYLNALKIENTLYWLNYTEKENKIDFQSEFRKLEELEDPGAKIDKIKNIFQSIFKGLKVYMFISPYTTVRYKQYEDYLNDSENDLVNVLDNYRNVNSYDTEMINIVKKVFYGAVSEKISIEENVILNKIDKENVVDKIDCTWVNDYEGDYSVVRLSSLDEQILYRENVDIKKNKPVWFRPVGCIVLKRNSIDYKFHMDISRTILSIKQYIIQYIEREFSYGEIQEAINSVYKDTLLNNVNHSIKKYINIGAKTSYISSSFSTEDFKLYMERDNFNDENQYLKHLYSEVNNYSFGLANLASISEIVEQKVDTQIDLIVVLSDTYIQLLKKFFRVASNFGMHKVVKPNQGINIIKDNLENGSLALLLDKNQFEYFLFEIIFNIVKASSDFSENIVDIEIESIENGIKIYNNVLPEKLKKLKVTRPYRKKYIDGVGTQKIIEMLEKNNYLIDFEFSENVLFVSKTRREYNICMKLTEKVINV